MIQIKTVDRLNRLKGTFHRGADLPQCGALMLVAKATAWKETIRWKS